MKVKLNLKPGDRGTKKLKREFGEKLLCVRYRHDPAAQKRYKTVEPIADKIPSNPLPPDNHKLLFIDRHEKELQGKIKKSGGKWIADKKLWKRDCITTQTLDPESRIRKE